MKKRVFYILIFVLICGEVYAQTDVFTIHGTVIDKDNKQPLQGKIIFTGKKRNGMRWEFSSYSDAEGNFDVTISEYTRWQFRHMRFEASWRSNGIRYGVLTRRSVRLHRYLKTQDLVLKVDNARPKYGSSDLSDFLRGYSIYPSFAIMQGRYFYSEVGVTVSPFTARGSGNFEEGLKSCYYLKAAVEFNYRSPFIIAPKLSFHYRQWYIFEGGMNAMAYIHSGTTYVLRPEVGLSLLGYLGLHYGYNIRLGGDNDLNPYLNTHQVTLFLRLLLD